ncbi:hypothetical protein L208DRAFT_878600 [Tricholoma matsutake]|nr:hypothetical protein L208DRAFT_878600 [Tricholoma matsutake 945]
MPIWSDARSRSERQGMNISWWSHSTRSLGNNVDRAGLLAGMRNRRQHVGRQVLACRDAGITQIATHKQRKTYPNYGLQTEPEPDHTVKKYDQSLLAVIGILDALNNTLLHD